MPLVFPLAVKDFWDTLPIQSIDFDLQEPVMSGRTEGGEILTDTTGISLWRGSVEIGRMTREESLPVMAFLNAARTARASFFVTNLRYPLPRLDQDGKQLAAAQPRLLQVETLNPRRMRIYGLPAFFALAFGDFLAFEYAASPVRYAYHQVVEPVVQASNQGVTDFFEVQPPIAPGFVANADVHFIRPAFKAKMVPGTFEPGTTRRGVTEGVRFQFQQTLR